MVWPSCVSMKTDKISHFLKKIIPVLDFWWRLLWVSKPEWAAICSLKLRHSWCKNLIFVWSIIMWYKITCNINKRNISIFKKLLKVNGNEGYAWEKINFERRNESRWTDMLDHTSTVHERFHVGLTTHVVVITHQSPHQNGGVFHMKVWTTVTITCL